MDLPPALGPYTAATGRKLCPSGHSMRERPNSLIGVACMDSSVSSRYDL